MDPINILVGNNANTPIKSSRTISFLAALGEKKELLDVLCVCVSNQEEPALTIVAITSTNLVLLQPLNIKVIANFITINLVISIFSCLRRYKNQGWQRTCL